MWGGYDVCLRGDKELAHTSVQDDIPIFVNATQLSFVLAVYYCIHLLLLKTKKILNVRAYYNPNTLRFHR